MRAEEFGEHRGLGFAQFGELGGDVSHRAVVLAHLDARTDFADVGRVAGTGERVRDLLHGRDDRSGLRDRFHVGDESGDALTSELLDSGLSGDVAQRPDRRTGEIVVRVSELAAAGRSQLEPFGGAAAAALVETGGSQFDVAAVGEVVEVTSDARRADAQPFGDVARRHRPLVDQQRHDGGPSLAVGARPFRMLLPQQPFRIGHAFHNTSVT